MAFWRFKFRIRRAGTAALLLAATFAGVICGPARAADSLYTVAKISVDVTAKDAKGHAARIAKEIPMFKKIIADAGIKKL